jgi:RNA polymerase sigma-70 factor, ECF subfamily
LAEVSDFLFLLARIVPEQPRPWSGASEKHYLDSISGKLSAMNLTAPKGPKSSSTGAPQQGKTGMERFVLMSAGPSQPRPAAQHVRRNPPIAGEEEAIEKARGGDARAFETLYSMHKRRVYSLCLRMLGNVAEAEDLTQEAFLQLYRKIGTFRGDSAFSTWLHRLAVNVVLMHLRRKGLPQVSLEETLEPAQDDGPRKDIGARDLTLSGSIDRVTLERAIENLPPGYRLVFVLHDVEGYEHNEIAEMLDCSIGNSKSQLHKARMKLRDLLHTGQRKEQIA